MAGDRFIELAQGEDRHVLDVLFHHASEAITVQDRDGNLVYANPRASTLIGARSNENLADSNRSELTSGFEMIDETGSPVEPGDLPGRRVLEGAVTVSEMVVGYRRKGTKHGVRWSRVRASPVKNDAGEVVWAINFFLDITEHVLRDESERTLARFQEALVSTFEVDAVASALADVVVPRLAEWAGIHMLDDSGHLRAVAIRHPETELVETLFALIPQDVVPANQDQLQARVLSRGKAEALTITDEVLEGVAADVGPELADVVRALDVRSLACLPLRGTDQVIGTLTVARTGPGSPLESFDIALLSAIADRAGVALANAALFAHEHELAEAVALGLRPHELPDTPGLTVGVRYRPLAHFSRVGGDFYDVIPLSPTRNAIFVGDIEGKGTSAAGVVAVARHTLKATIALDPSAKTVIDRLSATLVAETAPRLCTLAYLLIERGADGVEVEVSLAGHPKPLVLRADGSVEEVGHPVPPAGVFDHIEPVGCRLKMTRGDILLVYTDGLLARHDSSVEGLKDRLRLTKFDAVEDLLDYLIATVEGAGTGHYDDIVLLAFEVD